ncbi:glycerol-3-phosphate acyltransferase 4-like isoform X2 [Ctenocephalides felis]|uniref:glycerol-3-phosphate acyltransferase 4-like isoform X2 n=1 Tax=Ctenocephalides felis TaxID=7515 RepID=UPI000E6E3BD6|nr:glycerol-3-phosphate acyltransferase 4-like isoform X2 [Ctenocephalides felis]
MALFGTALSVAVSIVLPPFLMFILSILFLASIGKSLGVRRLYISVLLKIFEYGRLNIETARKQNREEYRAQHVDLDISECTESAVGCDQNNKQENGQLANGNTFISRDFMLVPDTEEDNLSSHDEKEVKDTVEVEEASEVFDFNLSNCLDYIKSGIECIIEDQVTSRFETEELKNWNLLTRTNRQYEFISWRLTFIWIIGFFMRYCFLLPIRILICFFGIGQRHDGFLGILQRALARASPHIWFERSEVKDRTAVTNRLRQHISDPNNPPILIFPEGTCINNTSVMQFKKGSFEVGGVIYPVAIKYDPKFGDAFWNSSKYSMMHYLYMMMSSWAIVCDVWYLPPMFREEKESSIDFANRVKAVIAKQGGLVDLVWDGQLKRMKPKKEWREKQQAIFSKRLKGE